MIPATADGEAPTHYYSVKHATSDDGMVWQTDDRLCLPYLNNEHAIARPVVTAVDGGYRIDLFRPPVRRNLRSPAPPRTTACHGSATAFQ